MLIVAAHLNVFATAVYCLLPALVLMFLLIHRVVWPTLSRVIYPLSRQKVLVNHKIMALVGCTCITIAFNLEEFGAREFLRLFDK